MRFSCEGEDLWKAVSSASQVSPKTDPRQALTDIWISVYDGVVFILGSSGSTTIRTTFSAVDTEDGWIGVPAAKFTQMCKGFREGVTLRLTPKDVLVLESLKGGSTSKIPGVRPGGGAPPDFGLPADYVVPSFANVHVDELRDTLSCVAFAASAEGHRRFSLQGVLFHVVEGNLRLVATDGKCMAVARADAADVTSARILVPNSTVGFLDKVLKGHDGVVNLGADATSFSLAVGGVILRSSITTEKFPPYEGHISKELTHVVRCDVKSLVDALKRLGSVIGDEDDCSLLEFTPGWVGISWKGRGGEGVEFVRAEHDLLHSIGISSARLAAALSVFAGSETRMGFEGDGVGPIFIEDAGRKRLCVVIPKALDLTVAEGDRVPPQSVASGAS